MAFRYGLTLQDWCFMTPKEFAIFIEQRAEAELDLYDHIYQCSQIANGYIKKVKSMKPKSNNGASSEEMIMFFKGIYEDHKNKV